MIKIGAISDIHGHWNLYEGQVYPGLEILIVAGDLCTFDDPDYQEKELRQNWEKFIGPETFPDLRHVFIIPGNHDYWIERSVWVTRFEVLGIKTSVIIDSMTKYVGISGVGVSIYGSPRCELPHAFQVRGKSEFKDITKADILVTHEVPRCYEIPCVSEMSKYFLPGSKELFRASQRIMPVYHLYGHIHMQGSEDYIGGVIYKNVTQMNNYEVKPEIYIINWNGR